MKKASESESKLPDDAATRSFDLGQIIDSRISWLHRVSLFLLPMALALCAAFPFFLSTTGTNEVFFLELELQTQVQESVAHVYYDYGRGFNEWDVAVSLPPPAKNRTDKCRFPLPAGILRNLRLDPFDGSGSAILNDVHICDARGNTVHTFKVSDFEPLNEIAEIKPLGKTGVQLNTIAGAQDPYIALHFSEPLKLYAPLDLLGRLLYSVPVFALVFIAFVVMKRWLDGRPKNESDLRFVMLPRWLTIISVALVLFARLPDRFLNPQFYAEDGFWYTAYVIDGWKTFFTPYGGYLLTVDRLVAWLSTLVPLLYAPFVMNLAAFVFTLAVIWRVLSPRNPLPHKAWLALAIVLIPRPDDIFMTITNIQWVLSLALIVLLISDDTKSISQCIYDYVTAVICGLTGVYSIITLPLFGCRFIQRRTTHSAVLFVLVGLAAAIQAWFVVHAAPLTSTHPNTLNLPDILATLGFQLFAHLFSGIWLLPLPVQGLAWLGVVTATLVGVLTWPTAKSLKQSEPKLYLGAILFLFSAASIFRFKGMLPMFLSPEGLSRYFFVPQVMLIWLLIANLATHRFRQAFCAILIMALVTTTGMLFRAPALVDFHWREHVASLQPGQAVNIPVNPRGWFFRGRLTTDGRMGPMPDAPPVNPP